MKELPVTIDCEGDAMLGVLHRGQGDECPVGIVIVVGGPQYRVGSHRQFVAMARHWAAAGYPVLRFDYRGMGDSDGAPRTFESVEADVRAAIDYLTREVNHLRGVVIVGLCDAASAGMMYCAADSRVLGLVAANPWARTAKGEAQSLVRHYYGARLLQWSFWRKLLMGDLQIGRSVSEFFGNWFRSRRAASHTKARHFLDRMQAGLECFAGPVLVLISDDDLTAAEFEDLCRDSRVWQRLMARASVTKVRLDGADHTFSRPGSLRNASDIVLDWLHRSENGRQ